MRREDMRLYWLALALMLLLIVLAIAGCAGPVSVAATVPPQGDPPAPPCSERASPQGHACLHTQATLFLSSISMADANGTPSATPPARYIIGYVIRDGECECSHQFLARSDDERAFISTWVEPEHVDAALRELHDDGMFRFDGGMRGIKDISFHPVPDADVAVLEKYLSYV